MINQVQIVSVPVEDQEQARNFYVEVLGFELRQDNEWGEGMRWVEVAPENGAVSLSLVTWFDSMPAGSLQGLVVATDDINTTHEELTNKGVHFDMPPTKQTGGVQAMFRDPDGNSFVLWQRQ